jgi:hypothetical protein
MQNFLGMKLQNDKQRDLRHQYQNAKEKNDNFIKQQVRALKRYQIKAKPDMIDISNSL